MNLETAVAYDPCVSLQIWIQSMDMLIEGIPDKMLFTTLLFGFALCHIKLQSPTPRDTSPNAEINSLTGPCGRGFQTAGKRNLVSLNGFAVKLQVADKNAQVVVNGEIGRNPQRFSTTLATVSASLETVTIPIDFGKLNAKGGDQLTIQIVENAADGQKYVCTDLQISRDGLTDLSI